MKRSITLMATFSVLLCGAGLAHAEDPFAAGADALAVKDSDGSSSLRAKIKLAKLEPDMIQVSVTGIDDSKFPQCTFTAKVIMAATQTDKHFKLIGRGKVYRFAPVMKMKGKIVDLKDKDTQNNLGACYYPNGTNLVLKVSDVDLKEKIFKAAGVYLK